MPNAPRDYEYPNKLVSDVVYRYPATQHFDRQDWIDLAMAALDQAGLSVSEQDRIEATLADAGAAPVAFGVSAEEVALPFCACGRVVSRCDRSRAACDSKRVAMIGAGDKADNRRAG